MSRVLGVILLLPSQSQEQTKSVTGNISGDSLRSAPSDIKRLPKGTIIGPKAAEINIDTDGSRSKVDAMIIVDIHRPSLRKLYNKYLKLNQSFFSGRIMFELNTTPEGDVANISIVSSTTGYAEFDNAVKDMVASWNWKAKNGSTTLTIPLGFIESKF
jgi:TonB family protein